MSTDLNVYQDSPLESRMNYAQKMTSAGDLIPKGLWAPVRKEDGTMGPPAPSPGKVLLVMETGAMLGLHPVAALQGVHIIEGKATLSPALMSAVVRKAGHTLRVATTGTIKGSDFSATATLIRLDDPDFTYSATWTIERATIAGLAGKDVWKKYGEAMCKARAISEVCREGAEDALMGIHYTPEEIGELVAEDGSANVVDAELEPTGEWVTLVAEATTKEQLLDIGRRATAAGEYPDTLRVLVLTAVGKLSRTVEFVDITLDPDPRPLEQDDPERSPDAERDPAEPTDAEYAEIEDEARE